jgi:glycosyltransferase involved in cell wall biosynthesis
MSADADAGSLPRAGIVMPLGEQRGGAELALLHFLRGVPVAQRDALRICFLEAGAMVETVRTLGYAVELIPAGRLRQPLAYLRTLGALIEWMRVNRLQVVLSWLSKAHFYAGPAAWWAGVRAAWWQHGLPTRWGLELAVTQLPADGILACSRASALAQRRVPGNRLEPVVIHPPVDLDSLRHRGVPAVTREVLALPCDAPVIGIVARLQRWKGVHLLIEAASRLRPEYPSLQVLVVGGAHALEPDYTAELEQLCRRLDMQSRVRFLGQRDDVPDCIAIMDVVVNASDGEPFGMVLAEAMALGKPVVAPRGEGPLEIVTHGVDGLLFTPRSVEGLADALRGYLMDPALRIRMGEAARQRAQTLGVPRFVAELSLTLARIAAS